MGRSSSGVSNSLWFRLYCELCYERLKFVCDLLCYRLMLHLYCAQNHRDILLRDACLLFIDGVCEQIRHQRPNRFTQV